MECSCEIETYNDDYDPVQLFNRKTRKARKTHKCSACHREILRGEEYEFWSYLFEGKFWEDKICNDCMSASYIFFPGSGFCPQELWGEIKNFIDNSCGEIPEDCIVKLTPLARVKVCDLIQQFFVRDY